METREERAVRLQDALRSAVDRLCVGHTPGYDLLDLHEVEDALSALRVHLVEEALSELRSREDS